MGTDAGRLSYKPAVRLKRELEGNWHFQCLWLKVLPDISLQLVSYLDDGFKIDHTTCRKGSVKIKSLQRALFWMWWAFIRFIAISHNDMTQIKILFSYTPFVWDRRYIVLTTGNIIKRNSSLLFLLKEKAVWRVWEGISKAHLKANRGRFWTYPN